MSNIIDTIKKGSGPRKGNIAFLGAFFVTMLIGVVWLTTLPARFTELASSRDEKSINNDDSTSSEKGIFELLGETKDQLGNIIESQVDIENEEALFGDRTSDDTHSALNELDMNEQSVVPNATTTPFDTNEVISVPKTPSTDVNVEPDTTHEDSAHQTATTSSNDAPRIIQIATTTSQKSE